jgi:hypothetical protein
MSDAGADAGEGALRTRHAHDDRSSRSGEDEKARR